MIQHRDTPIKGDVNAVYKDGQYVCWRQRDGMYSGIGLIRGYASDGSSTWEQLVGRLWIIDLGLESTPVSGYYPYTCILINAIDIQPIKEFRMDVTDVEI